MGSLLCRLYAHAAGRATDLLWHFATTKGFAWLLAGRDLRALFALLRQDRSGRVPCHTMLLLRLLAAVARHEGPTAFFDFSGGAGGIMRSGDLRLPGARLLNRLPQGYFALDQVV